MEANMSTTEATPRMVTAFFANNADAHLVRCAEGELVLAVIEQTLEDAVEDHTKGRSKLKNNIPQFSRQYGYYPGEPARDIQNGILELFGATIGLDPKFVRESVAKVYPWVFA